MVATLRAGFPIIRRQTFNLNVTGGFDIINQTSRFGGAPFTRDRLRVPFIRIDYDAFDPQSIVSTLGYTGAEPRWRVGFGVELRHGIDAFGTSPDCRASALACLTGGAVPPSRLTADPTALVTRFSAIAEFRPRAQYAPNTLLSYEQFSAGNYTIGRGFDPGTLIGDSGVGVRGEVTLGSIVPQSRRKFAYQGYAFVDAAWVWNHDVTPGITDPQKLQSAGGGVRVVFGDRFLVDAGFAIPFDKAGLQMVREDARFLISLTTRLFPFTRE
jgi:hemolysin activation/secretion protein